MIIPYRTFYLISKTVKNLSSVASKFVDLTSPRLDHLGAIQARYGTVITILDLYTSVYETETTQNQQNQARFNIKDA